VHKSAKLSKSDKLHQSNSKDDEEGLNDSQIQLLNESLKSNNVDQIKNALKEKIESKVVV